MKYFTNSPFETKKLAHDLAKKMSFGKIFTLSGNLGAGKTTFVQGFAEGLGIKKRLVSPTFIIVRSYQTPKLSGKFFHIDLYRLMSEHQLPELGLSEIVHNPENVVFIEWPEKISQILPPNTIRIRIKSLGDTKREIDIPE